MLSICNINIKILHIFPSEVGGLSNKVAGDKPGKIMTIKAKAEQNLPGRLVSVVYLTLHPGFSRSPAGLSHICKSSTPDANLRLELAYYLWLGTKMACGFKRVGSLQARR